jgi:hypothetical protein
MLNGGTGITPPIKSSRNTTSYKVSTARNPAAKAIARVAGDKSRPVVLIVEWLAISPS